MINEKKVEEDNENYNKLLEEDNENIKKTFIQRWFGKMKEGSLRGAIFAMSSLALGTGALTLPLRATQFGLFPFLIFNFLGALAAYWSLVLMIRASRVAKEEDYSRVIKKILGKIPGIIMDIILIVYLFGVFISYQVIIYQLIGRTVWQFSDQKKYKKFQDFENKEWNVPRLKYPIMFAVVVCAIPLCLLDNISKMRFISLFSVCTVLYTILVVAIQSPFYYNYYKKHIYKPDDPSTHANYWDIRKAFDDKFSFFTGTANLFFAYSCHTAAFPVFKTLKNNNERRINKVFFRSIILDCLTYILVIVTGFLTTPTQPESLVIFRKSIFSNDIFMTIALIAMALDRFFTLPINYTSFRISFFELFFRTNTFTLKQNIILTVIAFLISTLIGALYSNILGYISLLGGFCSTVISFLMPLCLGIKTSKNMFSGINIMNIIICIILSCLGFIGGIQTVRETILKL